ncbi:hypothetical protein [Halorussus sp. MSC15.2]|uniref:hypothetical protein n=1 Tax=Halorussus sp. MSC15.2 TaxID=2283638 RepID=UPI0013D6BA69|nr:hypothetical protein [Halorussus sp. MSC15.2]NEU56278.1 hypothetical protein [Halorussus sp. MSC15.2]
MSETNSKQEIVINKKHGGFGVSEDAILWMRDNGCDEAEAVALPGERYDDGEGPIAGTRSSFGRNLSRDNPILVECVRRLGCRAFGDHAELKVVEIPADVKWEIEEYDGKEWVAEKHRTWD